MNRKGQYYSTLRSNDSQRAVLFNPRVEWFLSSPRAASTNGCTEIQKQGLNHQNLNGQSFVARKTPGSL